MHKKNYWLQIITDAVHHALLFLIHVEEKAFYTSQAHLNLIPVACSPMLPSAHHTQSTSVDIVVVIGRVGCFYCSPALSSPILGPVYLEGNSWVTSYSCSSVFSSVRSSHSNILSHVLDQYICIGRCVIILPFSSTRPPSWSRSWSIEDWWWQSTYRRYIAFFKIAPDKLISFQNLAVHYIRWYPPEM